MSKNIALDIYRKYARLAPQLYPPVTPRGDKISMIEADLYHGLSDSRYDSDVIESYDCFITALCEQYVFMVDYGISVHACSDGDPYADSPSMMDDVQENQRILYFPTGSKGDSPLGEDHPMSRIVDVAGKPMVANDVFRVVHDVYGHAAMGASFSPIGEFEAWNAHRRCMPEKDRIALWSETRGQNVWTNFGPHMRNSQGRLLHIGGKRIHSTER